MRVAVAAYPLAFQISLPGRWQNHLLAMGYSELHDLYRLLHAIILFLLMPHILPRAL